MSNYKEQLVRQWASSLSEREAKAILAECVMELILNKIVDIHEYDPEYTGGGVPYWEYTGVRLGDKL